MGGSRLYLLSGREEIVRRRQLVPPGRAVEAWEDHHAPGDFWLGQESKALLDSAGGPLSARLTVDAGAVPIYYGPRIRDHGSLPLEESVQARVLSGHGIAAAWITLDRFGERISYEPQSVTDPVFYLRRVGRGTAHVWRRFATRREATGYMAEAYGTDPEAIAWAAGLPVEDYAELLARYASSGPDSA
jgi:hypothetical protein